MGTAGLLLGACSLGGPDATPTSRTSPVPTQVLRTPTSALMTPATPSPEGTALVFPATPTLGLPSPIPTVASTPSPTATARSTAVPTVSPTAIATAVATAVPTSVPVLPEGYRRFTSRINPYRIGYPRAWTAQGNAFGFGDVRGDLFLRETDLGPVSVNVLSESLQGEALSTEEYVRLNIRQIEDSGADTPERAGQVEVAGARAVLIQWADQSRPQQVYQITQAVWTDGERGWVVTLATPEGQRARYLPVLRAMLSTFEPRAP